MKISLLFEFFKSVGDLLRNKFGDNIPDRIFFTFTPSIERIENLISNGVFGGLIGVKKCRPHANQESEYPSLALLSYVSFFKTHDKAKILNCIKKLHQLKKK